MSSDAITLMTVVAGSMAAAVIDLRTRRVPNALAMVIAAAGVTLAATGAGRVGLAASIGGCVAGLLLMMPGYVLGGTGAGDVKLLAALGAVLGPADTVVAFLAAAIAGGMLALVVAAHRGRMAQTCGATVRLIATGGSTARDIRGERVDNRFAYAPAIAIGAVLASFAG